MSDDICVLRLFRETFPSMASLSYDKVEEKFVTQMFDDHQPFCVTFHSMYDSRDEQHCRESKRMASFISVLPSTYPLSHTSYLQLPRHTD